MSRRISSSEVRKALKFEAKGKTVLRILKENNKIRERVLIDSGLHSPHLSDRVSSLLIAGARNTFYALSRLVPC